MNELLISFAELSEKLTLESHQNKTHSEALSEAAHRLEQLDVLLSDVVHATERYRLSCHSPKPESSATD